MPVLELKTEPLSIKNLRAAMDGSRPCISFDNAEGNAYVLCFSQGEEVERGDLNLKEEDLEKLFLGALLKIHPPGKGEVRLQGVSRQKFHVSDRFYDFTLQPPERVQVWTLTASPAGEYALYIPKKGEQMAFFPACFSYTWIIKGSKEKAGALTVTMDPNARYTDGALEYQVGEAPGIPIPKSALGTEIPIVHEGQRVRVVTAPEYASLYLAVS